MMFAKQSIKGISVKMVLKAFVKDGWEIREGSNHTRLLKNGFKPLTIPRHNPAKEGILRTSIKQAGLSVEEFLALL